MAIVIATMKAAEEATIGGTESAIRVAIAMSADQAGWTTILSTLVILVASLRQRAVATTLVVTIAIIPRARGAMMTIIEAALRQLSMTAVPCATSAPSSVEAVAAIATGPTAAAAGTRTGTAPSLVFIHPSIQ
jgi:hypothetical protein